MLGFVRAVFVVVQPVALLRFRFVFRAWIEVTILITLYFLMSKLALGPCLAVHSLSPLEVCNLLFKHVELSRHLN